MSIYILFQPSDQPASNFYEGTAKGGLDFKSEKETLSRQSSIDTTLSTDNKSDQVAGNKPVQINMAAQGLPYTPNFGLPQQKGDTQMCIQGKEQEDQKYTVTQKHKNPVSQQAPTEIPGLQQNISSNVQQSCQQNLMQADQHRMMQGAMSHEDPYSNQAMKSVTRTDIQSASQTGILSGMQSAVHQAMQSNLQNMKQGGKQTLLQASQLAMQPGVQLAMQTGVEQAMQTGVQQAMQTGVQQAMQPGVQQAMQPGVQQAMQTGVQQTMQTGVQQGTHQAVQQGMQNVQGSQQGMQQEGHPSMQQGIQQNVQSYNTMAHGMNVETPQTINTQKCDGKNQNQGNTEAIRMDAQAMQAMRMRAVQMQSMHMQAMQMQYSQMMSGQIGGNMGTPGQIDPMSGLKEGQYCPTMPVQEQYRLEQSINNGNQYTRPTNVVWDQQGSRTSSKSDSTESSQVRLCVRLDCASGDGLIFYFNYCPLCEPFVGYGCYFLLFFGMGIMHIIHKLSLP